MKENMSEIFENLELMFCYTELGRGLDETASADKIGNIFPFQDYGITRNVAKIKNIVKKKSFSYENYILFIFNSFLFSSALDLSANT